MKVCRTALLVHEVAVDTRLVDPVELSLEYPESRSIAALAMSYEAPSGVPFTL